MRSLKVSNLVVPLHHWVTLRQWFGDFSITPLSAQHKLDVIAKKVGKGLPFAIVQLVPYGDEAVSVVFYRDNWSPQPLLFFALEFLCLMLLEMTTTLLDNFLFDLISSKHCR